MSELIDQIAKLEAKAHALKESVSISYLPYINKFNRENTLKPSKSSMSS
jgi:tetrahydromethanopterin S-methyltransferase subunit B